MPNFRGNIQESWSSIRSCQTFSSLQTTGWDAAADSFLKYQESKKKVKKKPGKTGKAGPRTEADRITENVGKWETEARERNWRSQENLKKI